MTQPPEPDLSAPLDSAEQRECERAQGIDLAEIEARANAATVGPWRVGMPSFRCSRDHGQGRGGHGIPSCRYTYQGWWDDTGGIHVISIDEGFTADSLSRDAAEAVAGTWNYEEGGVKRKEDAEFIAAARTDIPALISELRRERAARVALTEALNQIVEGPCLPGCGTEIEMPCSCWMDVACAALSAPAASEGA